MKLIEFLLKKTQSGELVVIRDTGYIVTTTWIDIEDLFARSLTHELSNKVVRSDEWGELKVTTQHGDKVSYPCHYVDV